MKRMLFLPVFLLFLPICFAEEWVFNSEYANINMDVSGEITLVPTSSNYNVKYVIVNLSFVPQDGLQEDVLGITTKPAADVENGAAIFRWDTPGALSLEFSANSNIKSFNKAIGVRNKIRFPLSSLPGDVMAYTRPSETIDSDDDEIVRLASELAKGDDDLYSVVFKLGDWTKNNIKYDLSSLTESVSQKASWVLKNKEGVCDELTNLFIAMNRALGIPAKFISGVAYTNAEQFEEGFGPHGWAEVYFPGYGWVPFDVTYGEFGFVDAGHIKLKESLDANDASTRFQWLGNNIEIKTSQLDIKAELKGVWGRIDDDISLNARAIKDNIGFGSYNLIEVDVENLKDHYTATELTLSKSKEIEIIGKERKTVLLKPEEEKTIKWIIKASDNLEEGYMYTFPFVVSSVRNVSDELRFEVKEDGKKFSLEGMEELIKESAEEESYSGDAELICNADKEGIYEYETTKVECNVKNIGNIYLEDLNACLGEDCRKVSLGITQEDKISFDFKPNETGAQEIVIRISNKEVSKSAFADITVYDKPIIEINEVGHPNEVEYKDSYEVSFVLNKKSRFAPNNVGIKVTPVNKEWEIDELNEDRKFILKMFGSELKAGENNFEILINYEDKRGNSYQTNNEFRIKLVNASILQRVAIFFKSLFW